MQILEITKKVVVCVNLLDEAKRKRIKVDLNKLSRILGVPVVGTTARDGQGLTELKEVINKISEQSLCCNPVQITYAEPIEKALDILQPVVEKLFKKQISSRWVSLRLLENNKKLS